MIIAFRVDASDIIGTGHVYRCLNLAAQYQKNNTIYFICKNHPYNLISKIKENYQVFIINLNDYNKINLDCNTWLGEDKILDAEKTITIIKQNKLNIDWLIIDHYAIQETWENELLPYVKNIGIIDDFTHRIHHPQCKFILNQQISQKEGNMKYHSILKKSNNQIKLYCGNNYLLLHPNYFKYFKNYDLDFSKNKAIGDDILGDAYEYLMRNFASESGKKKGAFYTPSEVSRVMSSILGIDEEPNRLTF